MVLTLVIVVAVLAVLSVIGNISAFRSFKKDQGLIAELNEECNEKYRATSRNARGAREDGSRA